MIRPPSLHPGDTIGVAAPASCFSEEAFARGIEWLTAQGFKVHYRDDIFERYHYLAGSVARRVQELEQLFSDPALKAIFFARGGYGVMQLLPHLDLSTLYARPLIIMGHSDLTPLLNLIAQRHGIITFHGPLVAGIYKTGASSLQQMLDLLGGSQELPAPVGGPATRGGTGTIRLAGGTGTIRLTGGRVEAPLCGGNLSLIAATLGTPYELDTRGRILLLEEVGERPYRVDRLFQQLELAGKLAEVAGVAIGRMVGCEEPGGKGRPLLDIYRQFTEKLGIPVVCGLPFGHNPENFTLPLEALASLDGNRGTLEVLQPVTE